MSTRKSDNYLLRLMENLDHVLTLMGEEFDKEKPSIERLRELWLQIADPKVKA